MGSDPFMTPDDFTPPVNPGGDFDAGPFTIHVITSAGAVIRLDDNATHGEWFIGRADHYLDENDPPPDPGTWTPSGTPHDKPYVSIGATVGTGDDSNKATFTVSRYGDTSEDLTVELYPGAGSAMDQDVSEMPTSVTILAGQSSKSFDVTVSSTETDSLTIAAILKASSDYWLGGVLAQATTAPTPMTLRQMLVNAVQSEETKQRAMTYYTPSGLTMKRGRS